MWLRVIKKRGPWVVSGKTLSQKKTRWFTVWKGSRSKVQRLVREGRETCCGAKWRAVYLHAKTPICDVGFDCCLFPTLQKALVGWVDSPWPYLPMQITLSASINTSPGFFFLLKPPRLAICGCIFTATARSSEEKINSTTSKINLESMHYRAIYEVTCKFV